MSGILESSTAGTGFIIFHIMRFMAGFSRFATEMFVNVVLRSNSRGKGCLATSQFLCNYFLCPFGCMLTAAIQVNAAILFIVADFINLFVFWLCSCGQNEDNSAHRYS